MLGSVLDEKIFHSPFTVITTISGSLNKGKNKQRKNNGIIDIYALDLWMNLKSDSLVQNIILIYFLYTTFIHVIVSSKLSGFNSICDYD